MSFSSPVHRLPGRMRAALWLALALWLLALLPGPAAAGPTCHGRFMNPITDICWSCLFPLTIGSASILSDGQPDIGNPSSPVCYCSNPPRIGVSIGFWEPVRMVDVTRTPFCMVGLGGIALDPGLDVPRGAHVGHDSQTRNSFYHAHWYANPILTWLEVLLDFPCLEKGSLDLAYLTEVDPLWNDDELTLLLNPDAVLFATPVAIAACAADCVAATVGFVDAPSARMTDSRLGSAPALGDPNSLMSAPPEKALPAPVMTMALTAASALAFSRPLVIAVRVA